MNDNRFDALTRQLTDGSSRRDMLRALAGAGIGFGATWLSGSAEAKRKGKRKGKGKEKNRRKKVRPNAFGCLSVGKPCRNDGQCCAGICTGKKGERTCRAHGTGICNQRVEGLCTTTTPGELLCNAESTCACLRTTAGSNFCASATGCADCKKDADCEALGFPRGSACVPVTGVNCAAACEGDTACSIPCGVDPSVNARQIATPGSTPQAISWTELVGGRPSS